MKLYIVRHAIAVPHGTRGIAENDRPLTPDGVDKMKRAAKGLARLEILPDLIFSSPLPRALQTAEIVRDVLGKKIPLDLLPALAPAGSRRELYRNIQTRKDLKGIMLVGHQPSLGEIAGEIAWGTPKNYVELKKGGTCCLELLNLRPRPRGLLLWLLAPSQLRKLGK